MVKRARLLSSVVIMGLWTTMVAGDRILIASESVWCQSLSAFLLSAQHPASGLLESFPKSADPALVNVAFTYDVAVSALVLAHAGKLEAASQALWLYRQSAAGEYGAFNTAYDIQQRRPTLEYACHGGPVFWTAISLIRLGERTGSAADVERGVKALEWAQQRLPHYLGGVAMGVEEPWSILMSVENNWAYYAALRVALPHVLPGPRRETLASEKLNVRRWLSRNWRNRGDGDYVKALDVYTHALLVGPAAHLEDSMMNAQELAVWAKTWIDELESLFRVPGTARYDYTDALEADQIRRARAGWLEGTEQVVVAYLTWAPFFEESGDLAFAQRLRQIALQAHQEVLAHAIFLDAASADAPQAAAIPNTDASESFQTFVKGWSARPSGEPALNGTNWAYLAQAGYNPFTTALSKE
jgi:hypothetical protein